MSDFCPRWHTDRRRDWETSHCPDIEVLGGEMTGNEIVDTYCRRVSRVMVVDYPVNLAEAIDAALAAMRDRCASFVEGAYCTRTRDALVEEIRALEVT